MSLNLLNHDELSAIQRELDQALHNHIQWHNALIRTLTCQLKGDRHDVSAEPHKECLFGQWYYEYSPEPLRSHPGYTAIGEAHQLMHQAAARMLQTVEMGRRVDPNDYDNFDNSMGRLRLEMDSLKREIESVLYTHDALTGAINRVDMLPILRELHEISRRKRSQESCIIMMDLDEFKSINDRYGHITGDKILSKIVHHIIDNLRIYDKIFRYGGEEFLIAMQNTSIEDCHQRIEELRREIGALDMEAGDQQIHETVSFGIAALDLTSSIETCIEHADKALYDAKQAGRNCTRIWSPTPLSK